MEVVLEEVVEVQPKVLDLIKAFWQQKKVVAAVCHAPWLLVETGIVKGRKVTSYPSIKTDVVNAGGLWEDSEVVSDQGLVTSRKPADLPAFCDKIAEEILEGRHERRYQIRVADHDGLAKAGPFLQLRVPCLERGHGGSLDIHGEPAIQGDAGHNIGIADLIVGKERLVCQLPLDQVHSAERSFVSS